MPSYKNSKINFNLMNRNRINTNKQWSIFKSRLKKIEEQNKIILENQEIEIEQIVS